MPRPPCSRRIAGRPVAVVFKPAGIPAHQLDEVIMTLDEFEAIRLADLNGLYQADAAKEMAVSRATFSRIVESAHRKVADMVVHGKALRVEGGAVQLVGRRCCPAHDGDGAWRGRVSAGPSSTSARTSGGEHVASLRRRAAELESSLERIRERIAHLERTGTGAVPEDRGVSS